jgi:hypothetical protein
VRLAEGFSGGFICKEGTQSGSWPARSGSVIHCLPSKEKEYLRTSTFKGSCMKITRASGVLILCLSLFFLSGCEPPAKLEFKTPYQVVFLDNTNAYIGKVQQTGSDFIRLTNVYYIQTQTDPEKKQVANTLIKRGNELHKPDFMYINTQHVLMIEPVTPDSQIAKLIEQSETGDTKVGGPSETEKK